MRLNEIARESKSTFKGDKTDLPIVGLEHLIPGELTLTEYDVNTKNTFTKFFRKGQVLFGRRRAYLKKASLAEFDGVCSGDIIVIEPIEGKVYPDLLPFIIQNDRFFAYAVSKSAGGLSPRVKWQDIADYELSLPSLSAQRELSKKLWAAYRLKESYKKLLLATRDMVKSQFIEMFGNPLSSQQKYPLKKLGECCEINPKRPILNIGDDDMVSFVPMQSVSEEGFLCENIEKPYSKVKKGFTYFKDGDVLFAKITPCMENGKGAIAENLTNGIGMGSTEFHVLRPIPGKSTSQWILALTRMPNFRAKAARFMSGTGGQKRVGTPYLENFKIGLPPIDRQKQFAEIYIQADKSEFDGLKLEYELELLIEGNKFSDKEFD